MASPSSPARAARASTPVPASVGFIAHSVSMSARNRRLVGWSSTTSTRRPDSGPASTTGLSATSRCFFTSTVKWNVLPRPSLLSTQIRPFIMEVSCAQMASPSPVPPYFRDMELSAWLKTSKISCCLSSGMPIPVSATEQASVTASSDSDSSDMERTTSPASVNLMALPTRLMTIWLRRPGSPTRCSGTSGDTW